MQSKKISAESGNATLDIVLDTLKLGKQAIVFANTKQSAEKTAEEIIDIVVKDVRKHAGVHPQSDDITIMVIKRVE